MAVIMFIAVAYGVFQLAVLSSLTRTIRISGLLLALAVGMYGAGVLSIFAQLLYTRAVAAVTDTPMSEIVSGASYTVDPLIEEIAKVLPLVLLVLLYKKIRTQWGLTDYVLVGAATGSGFTLAEALLRWSTVPSNASGGWLSGWNATSGFSFIHVPGLASILPSWVPGPVVVASVFDVIPNTVTNTHLLWSALGGLAVGLWVRGGLTSRLVGVGLLLYIWLDHATFNQRIAAPDDNGPIGLVSGAFELFNRVDWVYPLVALAVASYVDYRILRAARPAIPDVKTNGSLIGFATKGLPWTAMIAWRFELTRRNLYFAHAKGADTEDLHKVVHGIKLEVDAADRAEVWRGFKFPLTSVLPQFRGGRAYLPMLVPLILLIPALLYFVVGTFPTTSGAQNVLASPVVAPIILALGVGGLLYLAWQLVLMVRRLPQLRTIPNAEPIARGNLQLMNGFGALAVGISSSLVWITGTGPNQRLVDNAHILDALNRGVALAGLLLFFMMLALMFMFPPGGMGLAFAGMRMAAMSPAALAALAAALGAALGLILMMANGGGSGSGRGDDYWEDKYGDEADKWSNEPRNQRISDGNKAELQDSGPLKSKLPDPKVRGEFMKWLERGHKVGEEHVHIRPGSPEMDAAVEEFLAEAYPGGLP